MSQLPLFNFQQATELIGSQQQAKQLIGMLMNELPSYHTQIQQFAKANARRELRDLMHGMTGAAAYCGVPQLTAALKTLHDNLKNPEYTLTPDSISSVISTIEAMLAAWPNQ